MYIKFIIRYNFFVSEKQYHNGHLYTTWENIRWYQLFGNTYLKHVKCQIYWNFGRAVKHPDTLAGC